MATLKEYQDNAKLMGEAIADAAKKRGEIAVKSQEAERRAKRREAADRWADDPSVKIESLDFGGEPSVDGPITGSGFQSELEGLLSSARTKARGFIGAQAKAADELASAAPQDLTNIVMCMQLRSSAGFDEVGDLYSRCASVSWPLAKSVADAARKFGMLVWDEQGALDAETPRVMMRKADELLAIVAGRAPERPTLPAHGAQSSKHGQGVYAALELLEALDETVRDYDWACDELLGDPALVAVYDTATRRVVAVRDMAGTELKSRELKRMSKAHKDAVEGNSTDYAAMDARIMRAFGM